MATEKDRKARKVIGEEQPPAGFGKWPLKPGEDHMAEANALVNGDRQAAYGSPRPAYDAQAKVWSGLLAHKLTADLTAEDVVLMLAGMKLTREVRKHKRDNIVDLHGYALVLAHVRAAVCPTCGEQPAQGPCSCYATKERS